MQKVHFIAIGGAVMHNLAMALKDKGFLVTGSDDEINEPSRSRLKQKGLLPDKTGWDASKITPDLDAVILGMHARKDNPELLRAQELGVKVYSFPEYLYEASRDKKRIVIGGSHGKTTITSMVMHVLKENNIDFDYMVGASLEGFDTMVKVTLDAKITVLEGDEYLTSPLDPRPKFHLYHPHIALLSGIAWDHINVFPTRENYEEQFVKFIERMEEGAVLVYSEEDPDLRKVVEKHGNHLQLRPYLTPKFEIRSGVSCLLYKGEEIPLNIIGKHNLLNIEGARLVSEAAGVGAGQFYKAIRSFKGAARRLEKIAENTHSAIFRDFAHSPSKLRATTDSVKDQFPERQLTACMELHTFSSLNADFLEEFKGCMGAADEAIVYFNPATLEHKRLTMISPEQVRIAFGGKVQVFTESSELLKHLESLEMNNRNLLLMSSGTFGGLDLPALAAKLI